MTAHYLVYSSNESLHAAFNGSPESQFEKKKKKKNF